MQKTFNVYSDPGHGWAKVPLTVIYQLGLENKITGFSHERGVYAYLEEDLDLSQFIQAYREHTGRDPVLIESHTNKASKIRGYARYQRPNPPRETSTL